MFLFIMTYQYTSPDRFDLNNVFTCNNHAIVMHANGCKNLNES